MEHWRKRIAISLLTGVFTLGALVFPPIVSAIGNSDPITSGLRQGATNLQLNTGNGWVISKKEPRQEEQAENSINITPGQIQRSGTYAALGDSIAAGAGLTSVTDDRRCDRSTQAYPYEVARQQNLQLLHVACGGATAGDLFTRQGVSGPNIAPQLDTAFANGTPALITITAGANDMRWGEFMRKCARSTCGTSFDNTATTALRAAYKLKLEYAFSEIQRRSGGQPPTVVITGYSNPVSNYCKNRQQYIENNEINWLNSQRDQLNRTIRDVVKHYKFVNYASMNFTNHSMCASDSWWQGLNAAAPLHPNVEGQQAIADSINRELGNR